MLMKAKPLTSSANAALALLLAINLFNYIDRQVLAAVAPEIQKDFHADDATTGLLQTAFLASYMLIAPLFGWLGDRYRRWPLIGIGVILWSLASGASGLAAELGGFFENRLTWMSAPVFEFRLDGRHRRAAYDANVRRCRRRGVWTDRTDHHFGYVSGRDVAGAMMAWFYAAIPVGSALGYLLGGAILSMDLTWHWAFFAVLPPGIILGVWCFLMRDPPRGASESLAAVSAATGPVHLAGPAPSAIVKSKRFAEYRTLLKTPSYLLNTAGMTAMTFALGGIGFWMPKYIVWQSGGDVSLENGQLRVRPDHRRLRLAGHAGRRWVGDWLRPRFGGSYFLVSGTAMVLAFPLFLLLPITPFPLAWALIFATSFCLFFNTGPTNTILANVTHVSVRRDRIRPEHPRDSRRGRCD